MLIIVLGIRVTTWTILSVVGACSAILSTGSLLVIRVWVSGLVRVGLDRMTIGTMGTLVYSV